MPVDMPKMQGDSRKGGFFLQLSATPFFLGFPVIPSQNSALEAPGDKG